MLNFNKVPSIAGLKIFRSILGNYYDFKKRVLEYKTNLNIKDNYNPETILFFCYGKLGIMIIYIIWQKL